MGLGDFVQIGGTSGLDTSKMIPIDDFCGFQPYPSEYLLYKFFVSTAPGFYSDNEIAKMGGGDKK